MRPLEYTVANESNSSNTPSLQMRAELLLLTCRSLANEENRKTALFLLVGVIGVAGVIALFSTAFSSCSKISLENKTTETVIVYGSSPYKTKVSSTILLPYTTTNIELNGINSYANLYTSAGEMHFSDYGRKGILEDGANNKAIEVGKPPVFFWVCNHNYVKVSSSSNETSDVYFSSDVSYLEKLSDFFGKKNDAANLRGSRKIEQSIKLSTSRAAFFNQVDTIHQSPQSQTTTLSV